MFKVRDLMIDVVSVDLAEKTRELGLCRFPTRWCGALLSPCPNNTFCINPTVYCPQDTLQCPARTLIDGCGVNYSTCLDSRFVVIDVEQLVINPDQIDIVREQMDQVLEAAQARGAEVAENLQPKTLEQAEFLEEQLQAALREVKDIKDKLG